MSIFFRIFRNFIAYIKSELKNANHNRKKMMPCVPRESRISESVSSTGENPTGVPFGWGHSGWPFYWPRLILLVDARVPITLNSPGSRPASESCLSAWVSRYFAMVGSEGHRSIQSEPYITTVRQDQGLLTEFLDSPWEPYPLWEQVKVGWGEGGESGKGELGLVCKK